MEAKFGFVFLMLLVCGLVPASFAGRVAVTLVDDPSAVEQVLTERVEATGALNLGNNQLCLLCEEYAAEALDYLAENKTQTEIIDILHKSCSSLASLKQQCIMLVDYYAPLFLLEISSIEPEKFCTKVNLCQSVVMFSSRFEEDSCGVCHRAVSDILVKLKDPDNKMDILKLLLKGCESMNNYASKCKKMVFEYGPIILANVERFLETTDICKALHACDTIEEEPKLARSDSLYSI